MPLNLTKTYTVKSNAQADVRKAVVRGECTIGEFTVAALSGGFRIVPARSRPDAPSAAAERTSRAAPDRARAGAAEIIAPNAAAMTEALAADRDARVPPGLARLRADEKPRRSAKRSSPISWSKCAKS